MKNKKQAFTMAEVLLTLAVVGVVVALTVPSLVSRHKEVVLETKNLKAKQTVEYMLDTMLHQSGLSGIRKAPIVTECMNSGDDDCFSTQTKEIFNIQKDSVSDEHLLNNLKAKSQSVWNNVPYAFVTKDGIVFGYSSNSLETSDGVTGFYLIVDTNGTDNPNAAGIDIYKYKMVTSSTNDDIKANSIIDRTCEFTSNCSD